jgi:hypothetical protein
MNIFKASYVQVLYRNPVMLCYSTCIPGMPFRHRLWVYDTLTRHMSARTAVESKRLWVEGILWTLPIRDVSL